MYTTWLTGVWVMYIQTVKRLMEVGANINYQNKVLYVHYSMCHG